MIRDVDVDVDVDPDPGYGSCFFIHPGSRDIKKAPDPGSRSATLVPGRAFYMYRCKNQGHNMSDSQCRTIVAVVLGSIPAYSDAVDLRGRQMKHS